MSVPTARPEVLRAGARARAGWVALLVVALLVQAWGLYRSTVPEGAPSFAHADKVGHLLLFGVPAALAVLVGGRLGRVVLGLLVVHAPVSELLQGALLDQRAGDPWDVVANLTGIAVGAGLALGVTRRG